MTSPLMLDLFCCSGGASRGYRKAGFDTVGVDIIPQKHYPGMVIEADALVLLDMFLNGAVVQDVDLKSVAAIHASPPCQRYSRLSVARADGTPLKHPDLIEPTLRLLEATGKPYVLENVARSPMPDDSFTLCGSQFRECWQWHRIFATSFPVPELECDHTGTYRAPMDMPAYNLIKEQFGAFPHPEYRYHEWRGVTWDATKKEKREALPPVYTKYIGMFAMDHCEG
jgi:DNA (cytosine-5)-methyltransferase 1